MSILANRLERVANILLDMTEEEREAVSQYFQLVAVMQVRTARAIRDGDAATVVQALAQAPEMIPEQIKLVARTVAKLMLAVHGDRVHEIPSAIERIAAPNPKTAS